MSIFFAYLQLGIGHLLGLGGYEHLLFIVALCVVYAPDAWRRGLGLLGAFVAGYSPTLVLATLGLVNLREPVVEGLIALTLLIVGALGIWQTERVQRPRLFRKPPDLFALKAALALGFGLIHGLGLAASLDGAPGEGQDLLLALVGFDAGVAAGLGAGVLVLLALSFLMVRLLRMEGSSWRLVVLGAVCGLALLRLLEVLAAPAL